MLYFIFSNGLDKPMTGITEDPRTSGFNHRLCLNRNDMGSYEKAAQIAQEATLLTKDLYLPVDNGDHCSPRFDVICAPKVGDKVSYAFNGDSYPDGEIISVGSGVKMIIKTSGDPKRGADSGHTYYRRPSGQAWIQKGGTWGLVQGHEYKQNPSF